MLEKFSTLTTQAMKSAPKALRYTKKGKSHFVIFKSESGEHMEL